MKTKKSTITHLYQHVSRWLLQLFAFIAQRKFRRRDMHYWTEAQLLTHKRFAEAVRFAQSRLSSPTYRRILEQRAKPGHSAFNTAISLYLRHRGPDVCV